MLMFKGFDDLWGKLFQHSQGPEEKCRLNKTLSSGLEISVYLSAGPFWPTTCFCKVSFIQTQPHSFAYILRIVSFVLQWESWVTVTETVWLTKPKRSIIVPFRGKVLLTPALTESSSSWSNMKFPHLFYFHWAALGNIEQSYSNRKPYSSKHQRYVSQSPEVFRKLSPVLLNTGRTAFT